jgi:hypothetical protein
MSAWGFLIPHNAQPTPGRTKVLLFNDFCFRHEKIEPTAR